MKNLTISLILMMISSSILFAQSNLDIAPDIIKNPHATTFTDDLFDHQFDFPVGFGSGEAGIETNGNYTYTSKWNGDGFFCYEMDGTFLGWFPVTGVANVRDMAFDGTYFYGAAANTALYEMDFVGQSGVLISTLTAAVDTRAIAYDPEFDGFWGNNWSDPITLYDRTGGILNQFNCGAHSSYYGFARLNDGGEEWLYGFAQSGGANLCDLVQLDPYTGAETGVVFDAIGYSSSGTGIAGGLAAFDSYAPDLWTLLGIIQNETIFGIEGGSSAFPPELDLALTGIPEPNSGIGLGIENIVIGIKNQGAITQSNFEVRYRVNNCEWVTEIVPGPFVYDESMEYTFNEPYDFSEPIDYFIEAEVILEGDEFPENNYADKYIMGPTPGWWCYYSITMWDDYGDGWNGGYVQILGDGVEYLNATLAGGSGPETIEFLVEDGAFLTSVWTSGGWAYECSYIIYDFNSDPIFEDGIGSFEPTGGDIGFASCIPPDLDAGITEIISPNEGINLDGEVVTVNIQNFGLSELIDIPVGFAVDNGTMIMEIAPGPINSGSCFEYSFTSLAYLSEPGQHNIEVCTFLDGDENPDNDCLEKNIFNFSQINNQIFDLFSGYQFISSFIIPTDPDMTAVMADVLNDNLDFVRNSAGQTLRKIGPNWVNGIGDWIVDEGYLVKMFADDSFTIEGFLVDLETPIPVEIGYQFVSYLPEIPIDALIAFETIVGDNLDFIRNSLGEVLRKIGPNWINGIGDCKPTEGYLVKMLADDVLIYPITFGMPCPGIPTVTYEEQVYNTVLVGDQCWLKENLNIGEMINGTEDMTDNGVIEKYCYDNDPDNCEVYGGLYQWNEMMEYTTTPGTQGICPLGWHIPTDNEWKILEGTVDSQYSVGDPIWTTSGLRGFDAGLNLKSTSGWHNNGNGTDLYGFTALSGGYRNIAGNFYTLEWSGKFRSSSRNSVSHAWYRLLSYDRDDIGRITNYIDEGLSVRCLKNNSIIYTNGRSSFDNLSIRDKQKIYELLDPRRKNNEAVHFAFEGGNPSDAVYTLYIEGLEIGDEIAAYDGDILVGAIKINSKNKFENELPVFSTLNSGQGYIPGNPIILKAWDKSENKEYILTDYTLLNPYGYAWTENVFPAKDGEYSLLHFSTKGISDENEMTQTISIHPNPSEGIFNISIEGVIGKFQIKVLDIHGNDYRFFEIEETRNLLTKQIDLKGLAAGIYFISFSGKNFHQVKKIVIQ
jgi:uncharacterized protein (TIGR02145 family)